MTGRNDPCPCGSGRKYKNCHLAADTAISAAARNDQTSPFHEMDQRLVDELARYAAKRFPEEAEEILESLDSHPEMTAQLGAPWLVYVSSIKGRPVVDWYLEAKGWSLTSAEREWLECQKKSWVSIWEVVRVDHGRGLDLRDVLTGEERSVHEVGGSKSAEPHSMLLGRVVDTSSVSLICGMHSVPLTPLQAQRVVDRVRRRLRRKTAVSPDRLRDERIAWELLQGWSDEISRRQTPPRLVNTEGDPILLTEERWSFDASQRETVIQRVAGLENAHADELEGEASFTILRQDDTVVANVRIGDSTVIASTNSLARADAIRGRVEAACGSLLKNRLRSHTDPSAMMGRSMERSAAPRVTTVEERAVVRELKERHYAQWLNDPIPALDGKTPREAARTKSGRARLMVLLDDFELSESREPEDARVDVGKMRRLLGVE